MRRPVRGESLLCRYRFTIPQYLAETDEAEDESKLSELQAQRHSKHMSGSQWSEALNQYWFLSGTEQCHV